MKSITAVDLSQEVTIQLDLPEKMLSRILSIFALSAGFVGGPLLV